MYGEFISKKMFALCSVCDGYYINTTNGFADHILSDLHNEKVVQGWLNSLYDDEPKAKKPTIPALNSVVRCPKCDKNFNHEKISTTPSKGYVKIKNVINRYCTCGYHWYERCADGTEPNWEKME